MKFLASHVTTRPSTSFLVKDRVLWVLLKTRMGNAQAINASVSETFRAEPKKSEEFDNIINEFHNRTIDEAIVITRMTQLMRGHQNLLLRLRELFPQVDITIPPEAEDPTMSDSTAFLNNVKVLDLLYYHEDLTEQFLRFCPLH